MYTLQPLTMSDMTSVTCFHFRTSCNTEINRHCYVQEIYCDHHKPTLARILRVIVLNAIVTLLSALSSRMKLNLHTNRKIMVQHQQNVNTQTTF